MLFIGTAILLSGCNMPLDRLAGVSTPTPPTTSTPIALPTEAVGEIGGIIWHDLCAMPREGEPAPSSPPEGCVGLPEGGFRANGALEEGEPGIERVEVTLGTGPCPSTGLSMATTDAGGTFRFENLSEETYCVMIDPGRPINAQILIPGMWTSGASDSEGLVSMTIELGAGEQLSSLAFGWDYQFLPPYEPPATSTPSATAPLPPTMTNTPEVAKTPTGTSPSPGSDPDLPAGNPAWEDSFASGTNWPGGGFFEDDHVRFEVKDGDMIMRAFNANFREGWVLSWPQPTDLYLEGTFKVGDCTGQDRYGLFVRGTIPESNPIGYLFGLTCDGRYSLRSWDGEEFTQLISWTASDKIQAGSGSTNRVGFYARGDRLILFVNSNRLAEINDDTHSEGKFGLFIGAAQTPNFTVEVEKISYWNLP
jgi:hypothetical protein